MSEPMPTAIVEKVGRGLHKVADHPICITKRLVYDYFERVVGQFETFEDLPQRVSVAENFDSLLIPEDHPARSVRDTFYIGGASVLRTHTTAHQAGLLSAGHRRFLVTGDVFRRDTVDRTHYPVFHQVEGVAPVPAGEEPVAYLERLMVGLVGSLFPGCSHRVSPDHFPFTEPSLEVEVLYEDRWLEVLGCGVVHPRILERSGISEPLVAWGLGLERLAMVLFAIPDIRMFWNTEEPAFTDQFRAGRVDRYAAYSHLQPVVRDVSFWLPDGEGEGEGEGDWEDANTFHEIVRECSEHVESVTLYDSFTHPVTGRRSCTFALRFAPVARMRDGGALARCANDAVGEIRRTAASRLGVKLR